MGVIIDQFDSGSMVQRDLNWLFVPLLRARSLTRFNSKGEVREVMLEPDLTV